MTITKIISLSELDIYLKNNTSRSLTLTAMGCLKIYVPVKSVKRIEDGLLKLLAVGVHLSVSPLKGNVINLKRNTHIVGNLGLKTFTTVTDKYILK